jgi:hypothetical protein
MAPLSTESQAIAGDHEACAFARAVPERLSNAISDELWATKSAELQEELQRVRTEMEGHEGASQAYETETAVLQSPSNVFANGGKTGNWLARLNSNRPPTERHRSIWNPRNARNRKWVTGFRTTRPAPVVTYGAGPELKNRGRCGRYPGVTRNSKSGRGGLGLALFGSSVDGVQRARCRPCPRRSSPDQPWIPITFSRN